MPTSSELRWRPFRMEDALSATLEADVPGSHASSRQMMLALGKSNPLPGGVKHPGAFSASASQRSETHVGREGGGGAGGGGGERD